jgi:hypothetical protein
MNVSIKKEQSFIKQVQLSIKEMQATIKQRQVSVKNVIGHCQEFTGFYQSRAERTRSRHF